MVVGSPALGLGLRVGSVHKVHLVARSRRAWNPTLRLRRSVQSSPAWPGPSCLGTAGRLCASACTRHAQEAAVTGKRSVAVRSASSVAPSSDLQQELDVACRAVRGASQLCQVRTCVGGCRRAPSSWTVWVRRGLAVGALSACVCWGLEWDFEGTLLSCGHARSDGVVHHHHHAAAGCAHPLLTQHVQRGLLSSETATKDDASPVTVADYAAQAVVCRALQRAFPADSIVAEEDASDLRWVRGVGA